MTQDYTVRHDITAYTRVSHDFEKRMVLNFTHQLQQVRYSFVAHVKGHKSKVIISNHYFRNLETSKLMFAHKF